MWGEEPCGDKPYGDARYQRLKSSAIAQWEHVIHDDDIPIFYSDNIRAGETVAFVGPHLIVNMANDTRQVLRHGDLGVIRDASKIFTTNMVSVEFLSIPGHTICSAHQLVRSSKYARQDELTLYYRGLSAQMSVDGDVVEERVTYGQKGRRMGWSNRIGYLAVLFEGNTVCVNCPPYVLQTTPVPPLPGGHQVDEELVYFPPSDNNLLKKGTAGRVMGVKRDALWSLAMEFPKPDGRFGIYNVDVAHLVKREAFDEMNERARAIAQSLIDEEDDKKMTNEDGKKKTKKKNKKKNKKKKEQLSVSNSNHGDDDAMDDEENEEMFVATSNQPDVMNQVETSNEPDVSDQAAALECLDTGAAADDVSSLGGDTTCIVCFQDPKTHLAAPCGHKCACRACSEKLFACPICRQSVLLWVKVRDV